MVTLRTSSHAAYPRGMVFGDMPWDGIIGAVGNVVGAGISSRASKYAANKQLQATQETNAANLALAKQQNDWNLQQWQRETAWDSTASQLDRWREAGLNPNSFVGVASPVQAPNLQSAEMANQQTPDLSALRDIGPALSSGINDGLSFYLQNKRLDAEIRQINQNIKESESRTDVNRASIDEIKSKIKLNNATERHINQTISESKVRIEDLRSQIRYRAIQTKQSEVDFQFARRTLETRISYQTLQNMFMKANIRLTDQQAKNAAEEFRTIVANAICRENDVNMLPFTNWILQTSAQSQAFEGAKDAEKASMLTKLYDGISVVLDTFKPDRTHKQTFGQHRSQAYGNSAKRKYQRNLFGSHANPQIVLP